MQVLGKVEYNKNKSKSTDQTQSNLKSATFQFIKRSFIPNKIKAKIENFFSGSKLFQNS